MHHWLQERLSNMSFQIGHWHDMNACNWILWYQWGSMFSNKTAASDLCMPTIPTIFPARWQYYDDVFKWKHFPCYWPFVQGIHRSPVNSPHKGQWRGALMFSLICAWINGWVNNPEAGDLRRHRAHYDVTVMIPRVDASTVLAHYGIFLGLFQFCL